MIHGLTESCEVMKPHVILAFLKFSSFSFYFNRGKDPEQLVATAKPLGHKVL